MKKILSLFTLLLLLAAGALADEGRDGPLKEARGLAMNARTAHLTCAVDLTKTQLDLLKSEDSATLKTLLDTDLSTLKATTEKKAFDEAAKKLNEDIREGKKAVVLARKGGNATQEERKAGREALKNAQDTFRTCQSDALKSQADVVKKVADEQNSRHEKRIADLKAKGVNTTKMEEISKEAKDQKDKLTDALASGDQNAVKAAREELRNTQLHAQANFEITKLTSLIEKAEKKASEKNITVDFTAAKAKLDSAKQIAQPGKKYSEGEFATVWATIKAASEEIKNALKSARKNGGPQ